MKRHLRVLPGGKSGPPDRRRLALVVGTLFALGFAIWVYPQVRHSPHRELALYFAAIYMVAAFGAGTGVVYLADFLTRRR